MRHRWLVSGMICSLAVVLTGCPNGEETYLTGWWKVSIRESGTEDPYAPAALAQMAHKGSALLSEGTTYTVSSSTIHFVEPSAAAEDRQEANFTILNDDLFEGTVEFYSSGILRYTVDMRYERTEAPIGTLHANGNVDGYGVSINRQDAFAVFEDDDDSFAITICDSQPTSFLDIVIEFEEPLPTNILTSHTIGVWPDPVTAWVRIESSSEDAVSGSVTFTEFDLMKTGVLRGSGSVTLESGQTLAFDFDMLIKVWRDVGFADATIASAR